eukprot:gnl/TRDRNA2_/TRDRNA2_158670_c0_seq1.p1 gnl/TRDRNA2_/TRDRNA2_158670_c0~~gnl/TRDRNA2_/TRDRNA2_158670_c0_seq1.p1  ORF type:complete len:229 (+),score=29.67 gnl/TRDRNA2_/TRDRNA2_158670_c0_seq1:373-1059(+)
MYGKNASEAGLSTSEEAGAFVLRGGEDKSQTYGEILVKGMIEILDAGLCAETHGQSCSSPEGWSFFDLGSGLGKFPAVAALLGFDATGVELDAARSAVANAMLPAWQASFRECAGRLQFQQASFTEPLSQWVVGTSPRIIYINAVCMGDIWSEFESMLLSAEWIGSPRVVVAILGRRTAILRPLGSFSALCTWMLATDIHLYSAHLRSLPLRLLLQVYFRAARFMHGG